MSANVWTPDGGGINIAEVLEAMKSLSTTSTSIVGGNITFQAEPGKFFNVGSWLLIVYRPNTQVWMTGQVTSYDVNTGVLVFFSQYGQFINSNPALADWQITVSGSQAPATWAGGTVTNASTFNAAVTFNSTVALNGDATVAAGKFITLGGDPTSGNHAANKAYVDFRGVPVGMIMLYPRSGADWPISGWAECNGQAISRTTYSTLFTIIGGIYGNGDGVTTFNVPNMSRRVPVGNGGAGTGVLGNAVSNIGGYETHQLTEAEMPYHEHYQLTNGNANVNAGGNPISISSNTNNFPTSGKGGNVAHNNMQPSMVLSYRIKVI